jgi:hypothetical protein
MTPLIAKLALEWIAAERGAARERAEKHGEPEPDPIPKKDEIAIAADRVYQVMSGEVRYSECGPGDRAIWKGRFRELATFERLWRNDDHKYRAGDEDRTSENPRRGPPAGSRNRNDQSVSPNYPGPAGRMTYGDYVTGIYEGDQPQVPYTQAPTVGSYGGGRRGPRVAGYRERLHQIVFDTLGPDELQESTTWWTMFGNRHIGRPFMTNMQIGGMFWSDMTGVILALWIWTTTLESIHHVANDYQFTLTVGDKPVLSGVHGRELFQGLVLRRPIIVPVRQHFSVDVARRNLMPAGMEPFELVVCLDLLLTRDVG